MCYNSFPGQWVRGAFGELVWLVLNFLVDLEFLTTIRATASRKQHEDLARRNQQSNFCKTVTNSHTESGMAPAMLSW
jgi:hypothetical protein